jgi:hypothetical protein
MIPMHIADYGLSLPMRCFARKSRDIPHVSGIPV